MRPANQNSMAQSLREFMPYMRRNKTPTGHTGGAGGTEQQRSNLSFCIHHCQGFAGVPCDQWCYMGHRHSGTHFCPAHDELLMTREFSCLSKSFESQRAASVVDYLHDIFERCTRERSEDGAQVVAHIFVDLPAPIPTPLEVARYFTIMRQARDTIVRDNMLKEELQTLIKSDQRIMRGDKMNMEVLKVPEASDIYRNLYLGRAEARMLEDDFRKG